MGRPLLAFGADLLSHADATYSPSGYATSGVEDPLWPTPNITNGMSAIFARLIGTTVGFALDCGRAVTPDIACAFNTSFDDATSVRLQSSATSNFSSVDLDLLTTQTGRHRWIDLRLQAVTARRYWRWLVVGPSGDVELGEMVLASLSQTCPDLRWGYRLGTRYLGFADGETPARVRHRRAHGATQWRRESMQFVGTLDALAPIRDLADYMRAGRWPSVFVPDETKADVWILEWVGGLTQAFPDNNLRVLELTFQEQGGGRLDA